MHRKFAFQQAFNDNRNEQNMSKLNASQYKFFYCFHFLNLNKSLLASEEEVEVRRGSEETASYKLANFSHEIKTFIFRILSFNKIFLVLFSRRKRRKRRGSGKPTRRSNGRSRKTNKSIGPLTDFSFQAPASPASPLQLSKCASSTKKPLSARRRRNKRYVIFRLQVSWVINW